MARRSSTEGTVFQTSNGRWAAMVELPRKPDGSRNRRFRRARTQAEARRVLREMLDELHRQGGIGDGRRTVDEATEAYRLVRAGKKVAASTRRGDDRRLRMISTGLGRRRLADLTVADCDEFLERCAGGLTEGDRPITTPDQLRRVRAVLSAVLKNEIRTGTIGRNVAELAVLPPLDNEAQQRRRALSRVELAKLLYLAKGPTLVLIDLCGRNALRPAEARATQWCNLDVDKGLLRITNQMNADDQLGPVKTKDSARIIRLDEATLGRLEHWRTRRSTAAKRAARWPDDDELIATTRSGTPIERNNFARSLLRLCERAGIEPIRPYELRHTAISHQADRGRSSWEIADWAGTSERMISDVYRHQLSQISSLVPSDC